MKTLKKIKEISKFFKKNTKPTEKKNTRKLYAQALLLKISEILKIKKIFSNYRQIKLITFTKSSMALINLNWIW